MSILQFENEGFPKLFNMTGDGCDKKLCSEQSVKHRYLCLELCHCGQLLPVKQLSEACHSLPVLY